MKSMLFSVAVLIGSPVLGYSQLNQTFEAGEVTTNWGADWSGGGTTNTFLSQSLGGLVAGDGSSVTQGYSRSFQNNTAGVVLTNAYSLSMYVQLNTYDGPAGGDFEILDGAFGSHAGDIRTTVVSPGVLEWQAENGNNSWVNLLPMSLSTSYRLFMVEDPATLTYTATVQETDTNGVVLSTGSQSNLSFQDQNVINNHGNGILDFYIQAEAGGTEALVDNINIQNVPEPSAFVLFGCGLAAVLMYRLRSRSV